MCNCEILHNNLNLNFQGLKSNFTNFKGVFVKIEG
jgi:hypothetical protein